MPNLLLLTLLPTAPRLADDFSNDLLGLEITVYDLTVNDAITGVKIGTASGVTKSPLNQPLVVKPGVPPKPDTLERSILRHYVISPPLPPGEIPKSVATAVIVIDHPPAFEFPADKSSYDLRIVLKRGGVELGKQIIEYNAPVVGYPKLPTDPQVYFDYVESQPGVFPSAYVQIPPKPKDGDAAHPGVKIGRDGQTPDFSDLVTSINRVLDSDRDPDHPTDPTSLQERPIPLTATQSQQVAKELTYNRGRLPLPLPKGKTLEEMYTGEGKDDEDQERKQFEGNLLAYHSTHDAEALGLAQYVFAASAAVACEKLSYKATSATFPVHIQQALGTPDTAAANIKVLLNGTGPSGRLSPTFVVPAAFFYALGATLPTQLQAADRYRVAVVGSEDVTYKALQTALESGILKEKETTLTTTGVDSQVLNLAQAARRLYSLGSTNSSLPSLSLDNIISKLVARWLAYPGETGAIEQFWKDALTDHDIAAQYLELLLQVISAGDAELESEIKSALGVNDVAGLLKITDQQWRDFFMPLPDPLDPGKPERRAALLPAFTEPGDTKQRTSAFVVFLKKLLAMKDEFATTETPILGGIPVLETSRYDAISRFLAAYGQVLDFSVPLNSDAVELALSTAFPSETKTREWVRAAIRTIHFLVQITKGSSPDLSVQFSYIEALYARGFITAERVAALSKTQFFAALAGTVVYNQEISGGIYEIAVPLAIGTPDPGPEPGSGFTPVNPGDLVDCVPPPNLSPLGSVEYLYEMLRVPVGDNSKIIDILSLRRGTLGNLKATMANLETPIPLIDLVNESLETLASGGGALPGAVYDTASHSLAGFPLGNGVKDLHAEEMFDAIPEHSSPAVPVGSPAVYGILKADFTAPSLPYAQHLDINRSYLRRLGTTRFDVMRTFQGHITEFALDPLNEPDDFQRHLWRFPVRLNTAIEYLGISESEMEFLYKTTLSEKAIADILGFNPGEGNWATEITHLPFFLQKLGLSYCEFLDLWRCSYVPFAGSFPPCAPCCMKSIEIKFPGETPLHSIQKIIVFVRLWRRLEGRYGVGRVSFSLFAAICEVLGLFKGDDVNPDFVRQLVALLMLRDLFCLPLEESSSTLAHHEGQGVLPPVQRVNLLALWVGQEKAPYEWKWAIRSFLDSIEWYTEKVHRCPPPTAEFKRILAENFERLSKLAGFTTDRPWNASPTCTLRFAEILAKICASEFTVGEILFLFTNERHLLGDDPFPYAEPSESKEDPLNVPEDRHGGLWKLRKELLDVQIDECSAQEWTWDRIEHSLRSDFGILPPSDPKFTDPVRSIGEHLFPDILERHGHHVKFEDRRFSTKLETSQTSVLMWESSPHSPFKFEPSAEKLWAELPIRDEEVIAKLQHMRQLNPSEQFAVRELYFAPRVLLTPFAHIFTNFSEAVDILIQEPREDDRFAYFQLNFAIFHRRCKIIARHLAEQVDLATTGGCKPVRCEADAAWRILKGLFADENRPEGSWESDSGAPPNPESFLWDPAISGTAFSALLGLTGTGLLGEYTVDKKRLWRELRGPLVGFGRVRNEENVPVPTIIPQLNKSPSAAQQNQVVFRNGFAFRDSNAQPLGGASTFSVTWKGVLLVEKPGQYRFRMKRPSLGHCRHSDDGECHRNDGGDHGHGVASHHHHHDDDVRWVVALRRGQRSWTLLNSHWKTQEYHEAPTEESLPVHLLRGGYDIEVGYERAGLKFEDDMEIHPANTGFEIKYCGPDTCDELTEIPVDKLFIKFKDNTLISGLDNPEESLNNAYRYLKERYVSTLRDIRRTYQRAFKAILFAHCFQLSIEPKEYCHGNSELGFFIEHPANFLGTSYYPRPPGRTSLPQLYLTHRAYFDFNFLPVCDGYFPPAPSRDRRVAPSPQRMSALFDWWERIHDYRCLRNEVGHRHHDKDSRGPIWRLFYEAFVQKPEEAKQLVRYLGVDMSYAPLVLTYFDKLVVDTDDLMDERWSIRVWRAKRALDQIQAAFYSKSLEMARPDLWASTDPSVIVDPSANPPLSGNQNLTHFVYKGCLLDNKVRRYKDIKGVNDGLRERARSALLAYLCVKNRVRLPPHSQAKPFATNPEDLSGILLQDVEVGRCERSSRIDDAIHAVQTFVQRLRLGLEPSYQPLPRDWSKTWDSVFCNFEVWQNWQRRRLYGENWIHWQELQLARKSEAFRFLEDGLEQQVLTLPESSPPLVWPSGGSNLSQQPKGIQAIQGRGYAVEGVQTNSLDEGIRLLGTPARHARPSWLAAVSVPTPAVIPISSNLASTGDELGVESSITATGGTEFPLWFQAAVRLGTRFVRIAAAGLPPAMFSELKGGQSFPGCGCHCGKDHQHPPVIDEYYFWLTDATRFDGDDIPQNADIGKTNANDPTSDWDREGKLPLLLHWPEKRMLHLAWTRVHYGEFEPPRRSTEGVPIGTSTDVAMLQFRGRKYDSLTFTVLTGGAGGFRYDMATDSAVLQPEVVPDSFSNSRLPTPLPAFPYFVYFNPGAPLTPTSSFATVLATAAALRANCRFESALSWCRAAFDPLTRNNEWSQCPQKIPGRPSDEKENQPSAQQEIPPGRDEPCCPTSPVKSGISRSRAVMLEYLEILLQWGDTLMCRNTTESVQQALVLFNEASRILGPQPVLVKAQGASLGESMTLAKYTASPAPLNPRLLSLYEQVLDRKSMVRSCMSVQRLRSRPGRTITNAIWKGPASCNGTDNGCISCCIPYRFRVLLPKALELAGAVKSLGGALLGAYERGDSEYLGALRMAHDRQIMSLGLEVKQFSFREADWQVQAIEKQIEGALTQLRYNQQLLQNGLSPGETASVSSTNVALGTRTGASASEVIGQGLSAIPDMSIGGAGLAGSPLEFNQLPIGTKLAGVFQAAARVLNIAADIAGTQAGLSSTQAGWQRRADDWQHQVDVFQIEIAQIKRQQIAAQRRRDITLRELNSHQRQLEHFSEVQEFLRDKLTKHGFYLFLQQETAALYRQTYNLALQTAKEAQMAFQYERRDVPITALPEGGWDSLQEGLMAGERLELALHTMDRLYMRTNCREHELSKNLSLRLHFPLAFLQLITTGACEFEIPEWMFDLDYPGDYMRRIKSVSLTIPCVVGPYVGVHCRLQQLSSALRISPDLSSHSPCSCSTMTPTPSSSEPSYDSPHHLTRQHIPTTSIATSTGQNDSGLFELTFRDELLVPFEFSGAVSRWRIELPAKNNSFSLDSVSDVVMHLNYTARPGGAALEAAANESAQRHLPGGGVRFFDTRHEFASDWRNVRDGKAVGLKMERRMFPFLNGGRGVRVTTLQIFVDCLPRECGGQGKGKVHGKGRGKRRDHIGVEVERGEKCKTETVVCVGSDGWYHGELMKDVGVVDETPTEIVKFWISEGRELDVKSVYFLCGWEAVDRCRECGFERCGGRCRMREC